MPDLLGATNPVPGYDKSLNNNRMPQTAPENPNIQNAPDLSKVSRADRRTDRQDSNLQGDGPIRYDSNFQTFLPPCPKVSPACSPVSGRWCSPA